MGSRKKKDEELESLTKQNDNIMRELDTYDTLESLEEEYYKLRNEVKYLRDLNRYYGMVLSDDSDDELHDSE